MEVGVFRDRRHNGRRIGVVAQILGIAVTAMLGEQTLQAVSDDEGRYRFDPVSPGTYIVSAYYAVDNHGQIEVRRSDIEVPAQGGVIVPLWIETGR